MKKAFFAFLFLLAAAHAAEAINVRPYWFNDTAKGWVTTFFVQNVDVTARVATVTFYNPEGQQLAATSRTINPAGLWKFDTSQVPALPSADRYSTGQGIAIVSCPTASVILGYTAIGNANFTGFNPKYVSGAGQNTTFTQE